MKKLVLGVIFSIACILNAMAQKPTIDVYTGSTNLLNKIYDTGLQQKGNQAVATEVTTPTYEGSKAYEINYIATAASNWWAGNGGFNINGWAWGKTVDLTGYTHLKIAYKGTGTADNTLKFSFTDSTILSYTDNDPSKPVFAIGNDVVVANISQYYVVKTYALSSFVGTGNAAIDLSNIQSINWVVGLGAQVTDGKFYIDNIQFVDIEDAPTISSIPASGKVGDTIIIRGTNLAGVTNAKFNTTGNARIISAGNDSLQVIIPTGATSGTVSLTNAEGSVNSANTFTVSTATGIASSHESLNVSISPNPTSGIFAIKTDEAVDSVIVTDYLGNVVSKGSDLQIDMTNHADGMYFVTILSKDKSTVKKIVKK